MSWPLFGIIATWLQLETSSLQIILPQSATMHCWVQSLDVQVDELQLILMQLWWQYCDAWHSSESHRYPSVRLADGTQSWPQENWGDVLPHDSEQGGSRQDVRFCIHWSLIREVQVVTTVTLVTETTAAIDVTQMTIDRNNAILIKKQVTIREEVSTSYNRLWPTQCTYWYFFTQHQQL